MRQPSLPEELRPWRAQAAPSSSALTLVQTFASLALRCHCGEGTHRLSLAAPAGVGQGQGVTETATAKTTEKARDTMSKQVQATAKPSIYQTVTDRIVKSLEAGIIPWEKPWQAPTYAGGSFPHNFRTGKPYRGVNVMLLWSAPYSAPFWLTYKQAQEMGGSVRKGEKGTSIVFYKQFAGKKDETEQVEDQAEKTGTKRSPYMLTSYTVFNVEQCDGLTLPQLLPAVEPDIVAEDAACEALVEAWQGKPAIERLSPTEYRACYRPVTDTVHMPARHRFVEPSLYYSTLFHELVHSTGHASRLNRTFGAAFGDDLYSREELIAETGSAFLSAIAGIGNSHSERNTTAYLQNWIGKLQADNRLILQAAAAAQKAVDLITGQAWAEEQQEQPA